MKTASPALIDALKNYADIKIAEVYTFTLSSNSIFRFTSADVNISWAGSTFYSEGMLIDRGSIKQNLGLEINDLEVTIIPTTANIAGIGWLAAMRNGALDGATVKLERLFYKWWGVSGLMGGVTMFAGFVSDIDPIGRTTAILKVRSITELLSVQWPPMTYESQCIWKLYFHGCGVNKTAFTLNGNTIAGGNVWTFGTSMNQANNYFDGGVIRFTSGNSIDTVRSIRSYSAGIVSVNHPLNYIPSANESFTIYPGCDKTHAMCLDRFTNSNNFRGFPYIPSPETGV